MELDLSRDVLRISLIVLAAVVVSQLACGQSADVGSVPAGDYGVAYSAHFLPEQGLAEVTLEIDQPEARLLELNFNAPQDRYSNFIGDGKIFRKAERVIWQPPSTGGRINYLVQVNQVRGTSYDAVITDDWAVLRLDDLFPPASVRSLSGSRSNATLNLSGPKGWSFETGYGRIEQPLAVTNPDRRFVRPIGWLAAGKLGVRRDQIGGREIVVAAPRGESFRRLDLLAFLNWTLDELVGVFPDLPDYLLVVGGSQDMWRGALSGPASLYLHPDRPLISENATSTLLHELVHVAMSAAPAPGADWIAEGLAEYYSLRVLLRSGGITQERYEAALERLERWSQREQGRLADPSKGADTAYAVLLFAELDKELQAAGSSLDLVVERLFSAGTIDQAAFRSLLEADLGGPSATLADAIGGQNPL